jgi:hypothetical protein
MRILRIPFELDPHRRGEALKPFTRTMELKKELEEHDLVENRDYNCFYMSGSQCIEVRFYGENESAISLFALKYS